MLNSNDTVTTSTRPPISAELLEQAVSIERGMSFSLTTDDTISAAHSSDTHHVIVTWSKTETAKEIRK